mgnify:CR=1 FL=1
MIDEFQDIDSLQYELMEVLCGYHKNLFIVGDPDQTIYTWRGANVKYLLLNPESSPKLCISLTHGIKVCYYDGELPLYARNSGRSQFAH